MRYEVRWYVTTTCGRRETHTCMACGASSDTFPIAHAAECDENQEILGDSFMRLRSEKAVDEAWEHNRV